MRVLICFLGCLLSWDVGATSTPIAEAYIERYHEIAIKEMHRAGIPASIKLAQGLLESDWGRSDLATKANNHFGIKCGSQWSGPTFHKEDDDYDKRGRLVKSCFRAFADAVRSYEAHSDFLTDPNKAYRYGQLFELAPTDYEGWAHGLRAAGYATDPAYPQKLISVIEKYELYRFDQKASLDLAEEHVPEAQPLSAYSERERHAASITTHAKAYKLSAINRVPMIIIARPTAMADIAASVGLSTDLLLQYNDGYDEPMDIVQPGAYIYVQRKKRSFVGDVEYHTVKQGETMESIAQRYGMRVENLYAKNKMPKDAIPEVGEQLNLRHSVLQKERPAFTRPNGRTPEFLEM